MISLVLLPMVFTHPSFWLLPLTIGAVLALLSAPFLSHRVRVIYRYYFANYRRERVFLGSVGFFIAVGTIRGVTILIHNNIGPFHNISMRGRHIHHLVWGILVLLLVGYGWLLSLDDGPRKPAIWTGRAMALLYGIGSALTLDEFALWLNLSDVYWAREGRESLEALGLFGAFLTAALFGAPFFRGLFREAGRLLRIGSKQT